jgi:polar amino acid transport system ATP-binding protein
LKGTTEVIEARGIVKTFGNLRVLDGVSLSVRQGEVAAVIGPSGGGKSTLLRCLNGLESFQEGEVEVGDLRLCAGQGQTPRSVLCAVRARVGMVFQQFHLFPHMSALENVMAGPLYVLGLPRDQAEVRARTLLERVELADKLHARADQLSGGQQQRVAIARALAVGPQAILFDEPTSALDPRMAGEVLRVIAELAGSGQTMVVVTHALDFARGVAHSIHVMHGGRIIESGPPAQVFEKPRKPETCAFLQQTAVGS